MNRYLYDAFGLICDEYATAVRDGYQVLTGFGFRQVP